MIFNPQVNQEIVIDGIKYRFAEHPAAPGIPYGQSGRAATVYKLESQSGAKAFKVFFDRYRSPSLVGMAARIAPFAAIPGLSVCRRTVLTPQHHKNLLQPAPELIYAVLMPWIEGPTWMQVMQNAQVLSFEQSLSLSRGLAALLSNLEQQGIAHCDLSNANLLLPALSEAQAIKSQSPIELVDVEQIYAASLDRPTLSPSGSDGYAHRAVKNGVWEEKADRFSGAILLAEILGWADPGVRDAAFGESYFDPNELQHPCARFELLKSSIARYCGNEPSHLLERAWNSDLLADCPTFGEWMLAIPEQVNSPARKQFDNVPNNSDEHQSERTYSVLLTLAEQLLSANNLSAALETYRRAQQLTDSAHEQERIQIKILNIERLIKQAPKQDAEEHKLDPIVEDAIKSNTTEPKTNLAFPRYFYGIGGFIVIAFVMALSIWAGKGVFPPHSLVPSSTETIAITPAPPTYTPTITLIATLVPSATITSTPVPTHTNTPEPTPVPNAKILYQENFEKGTLSDWENRSSTPIKILEEKGNHYMHYVATGFDYPGIWKGDNVGKWKNYAFENRVRLKDGGVFMCFRVYGKQGAFYNVFLDIKSSYVVFADYDPSRKENEAYQTFGGVGHYFPPSKWYLVRVEARGENLSVYIDNDLVTSAKRSSLDYGGIAYYTGENSEFDIDDIRVWSLDN